jgi:hypothetical protein
MKSKKEWFDYHKERVKWIWKKFVAVKKESDNEIIYQYTGDKMNDFILHELSEQFSQRFNQSILIVKCERNLFSIYELYFGLKEHIFAFSFTTDDLTIDSGILHQYLFKSISNYTKKLLSDEDIVKYHLIYELFLEELKKIPEVRLLLLTGESIETSHVDEALEALKKYA